MPPPQDLIFKSMPAPISVATSLIYAQGCSVQNRYSIAKKRFVNAETKAVAPRHGFEPRFTAPKAAVLPLDDRGKWMRRDLPLQCSVRHSIPRNGPDAISDMLGICQDAPMLVLASGSPRRAEILSNAGIPFVREIPSIDETPAPGELPLPYVTRLAREKAEAIPARTTPDRARRRHHGRDRR